MKVLDRFADGSFENSLVIGYFGGTNYGDELLLELFQMLLSTHGVAQASLYYTQPQLFAQYHAEYGYRVVNASRAWSFLRELLRVKTVVIGGGGLWGLDSNRNILVLGVILLLARYVLRKQVYLVSVGYYNSANWYGRMGARLAAWAATEIYARDKETYDNFTQQNANTILDADLSSLLPTLDVQSYRAEATAFIAQQQLATVQKIVGVRRFNTADKEQINTATIAYLAKTDEQVCVFGFEDLPETVALLESIRTQVGDRPNIRYATYARNPLVLFAVLQLLEVAVVAPQYHVQIVAHHTGTPFLPLAYDNKLRQLHVDIGLMSKSPAEITVSDFEFSP